MLLPGSRDSQVCLTCPHLSFSPITISPPARCQRPNMGVLPPKQASHLELKIMADSRLQAFVASAAIEQDNEAPHCAQANE